MNFDPVDLLASSTREQLANNQAKSLADCMQAVWNFTREEMTKSQATQVKAANKHRKEALRYQVGDMVWLSMKNIKTERPSKKLDHKMIGPYKVKELVRSSYWLDLPTSMRIHDVFYPNLLRPAATDPLPGQHNKPEPPVVVDGEEEWEVDDILDAKRGKGKKLLFQVKWKGYDEDKQWYPASDFDHAKDVVDDFYKRHPSKPRGVVK